MKAIRIKELVNAVNGIISDREKELLDSEITSVGINSKEVKDHALFVAIKGAKVDAHDFIDSALTNGAIAVLTERQIPAENRRKGKIYIQVADTKRALQKFAAYYRSLFTTPIIGITGSVGKTTTKEMIAAALGTQKRVLKTRGNQNSQIGVALMMFDLDDSYDLAVIEMGISEENEMQLLAEIAKPESAVITNIGVSHIGQLGSKENIRKEKCNIVNYFSDLGGTLFICGNDDLLSVLSGPDKSKAGLSKRTRERLEYSNIILYGTGSNCNYLAENIESRDNKTCFTLRVGNRIEEVGLSVLGEHHANNALAAFAVADKYGVDWKAVKQGLQEYRPVAMRGEVKESNGIRIIDDTYNASPDSMISGLRVLFASKCEGKRFAALGDVLELGGISKECHKKVGEFIGILYKEGKRLDELITVGREAVYIADAVRGQGVDISIHSFLKTEEAADYLKKTLREKDLILVKGSRGMHMDEVVMTLSN